jgi:hypothetical protein
MKKQITEPDFIGGQGSLTKEEEMALSKYFAKKGKAVVEKEILTSTKKKNAAASTSLIIITNH